MDSDALKYLETEREISSFRLESLKRLDDGFSSTKRLIAIEEEFLSIKFELVAEALSELLAAINIFRNSRTIFYETYKTTDATNNADLVSNDCIELIVSSLKGEITARGLLLDSQNHVSLGAIRSEGRVLVILLCILKYFEKSANDLKALNINIDENDIVVEMNKKYYQNIFSFYNEIIGLPDTLILNKAQLLLVSKTKKLHKQCFSEKLGTKLLCKKIKGIATIGCFLPMKHIGRETSRPYYANIVIRNNNVSSLFSLQTNSVLPEGSHEYHKFISMIHPDELASNLILLEKYEDLVSTVNGGAFIDIEKSFVLIPSSRTEDDGVKASLCVATTIFSNLLTRLYK